MLNCKWFEPRSHIIRRVNYDRPGECSPEKDKRFDKMSGSHHQSEVTTLAEVDSDDDFRSVCRNVSQYHHKQSF